MPLKVLHVAMSYICCPLQHIHYHKKEEEEEQKKKQPLTINSKVSFEIAHSPHAHKRCYPTSLRRSISEASSSLC
jgi:hypothetical protein